MIPLVAMKDRRIPHCSHDQLDDRKRPRRFSSGWEDKSTQALPKGNLTPRRKGNTPRKTVTFDQDHAATDEGLSFKDLGQSAKKKTEEAKRSKKPHRRDEVLKHAGEDARNSQDVYKMTN
jgi:hypothetical protein